ncbi:MAG: cation:proton antiporter [Gammaproteobacteria bacterium]|nr:cation:proton antiporter [Gammaproteobacteria bacterium]
MNHSDEIIFTIFIIFSGAAVFATLALYARQTLLIAYIALGVLLGPSALGVVENHDFIQQVADIGIMFLLFLLGLSLNPNKLVSLLKDATLLTLVSSAVFAFVGYVAAYALGFKPIECVVIAGSMVFSSTIIGLKLLPTTVLHHRHTGEVIVSILLLQDLIAIIMLLLLHSRADTSQAGANDLLMLVISLPILIAFTFYFSKYVLSYLFRKFDKILEYVFLVAIGWCLGISQLASWVGLSHEIGAFIAGVSIATSPIALFIAESLKPLRDFFLIIFFFAIGASFQLEILSQVILPALIIAGLAMLIKPITFRILLTKLGQEDPKVANEIGYRIGQLSEFSILLGALALNVSVIGEKAAYLIHVSTIITFVLSSYLVVLRFPTPIAVSDRLRRD